MKTLRLNLLREQLWNIQIAPQNGDSILIFSQRMNLTMANYHCGGAVCRCWCTTSPQSFLLTLLYNYFVVLRKAWLVG